MAFWSRFVARPSLVPLQARPSLTLFYLISGAFVLTLVPEVTDFPVWLSVVLVAAMALRAVLEAYRLPLPSVWTTSIVAVVFGGFIFLQYGHMAGRDAGTAFTAGLLALKFYELRRSRDVAIIIFSCFFLVMSALLYSQAVELFIYCLIMMWVLTALLIRVQAGDQPEDRLLRMLQNSGFIFLQALPLGLFLFFFFPRYNGALGLRFDEASIGLNDVVTPGSIAKLSENQSEAMYVQFDPGSNVPATDAMYWRALVLWNYDHGTWTPGNVADEGGVAHVELKADPDEIQQTITVRAHHRRWLFGLDVPVSLPFNASAADPNMWSIATAGHVMQLAYNQGNLDHLVRYTINSRQTPPEDNLIGDQEDAALALPDGIKDPRDAIDPRVKALADELHRGLSDGQVEEYVNAVIHYFRHGGFVYDIAPGRQGPDWLPYFLFTSKVGFCEHFASAFGVLMRLEHVPARMVIGYQGADYNPYKDIYTVYQSNAHAWDEVWIRDKSQPASGRRGHWERVDPTALIMAGDPADQQDAVHRHGGFVERAPRPMTFVDQCMPTWAKSAMHEIILRREEIEVNWDNVVLSYNSEAQTRLAQALGFGNERIGIGLFLLCAGAGVSSFLVLRRWIRRKVVITPVENLYAVFCRSMARRGLPRALWEGPLAYTERVAEAFPNDKPAIHRVGSLVARARYGATPPDAYTVEQLQTALTTITASNAAASSRNARDAHERR
jgi:hypothetical protein